MGVDADRQATARARRSAIIAALHAGFDLGESASPASRFRGLVQGAPRIIIANADIDGVVSAQMLSATTGWKLGAIIDRQGNLRIHPDHGTPESLLASDRLFGVDVFSPLFPNVSNHPIHFGPNPKGPQAGKQPLYDFDRKMSASLVSTGSINLSAWVQISAMGGSDRPDGIPYKYPLGSAQVLLALLEVANLSPRMYDRQYLPWLIANCDGGLDTIRTYSWNAEVWWSALAATVGPASLSESIYRLATQQRPNEFIDIDRRLRYDEPERSAALNTKWNISDSKPATLATVVDLLLDLSGWPDPILGSASDLPAWSVTQPTARALPISGVTKVKEHVLSTHLSAAASALHVNFSVFRERGTALGWMLPRTDPDIESAIAGGAPEELVPEEEPSVPSVE